MREKLSNLINVKSIVTLAMTGVIVAAMFAPIEPPKEIMALFCSGYGSIITYFFTRKEKED